MAGPVSLETGTPSAPCLKGRSRGVSEKLPIRIRKPEALAQGEHRDVPRTDLVMALGPARNVPPALGSRELGCQLVVQGGLRERVEGREDQPMYLPARRPRSPAGRKEMANSSGIALWLPSAARDTGPCLERPFPSPGRGGDGVCTVVRCSITFAVGKWNKQVSTSGLVHKA